MTTEYSGGGDPVRSLELLWDVRERPRRGPRPRLTARRVAEAAIELADAEGLAALSMRRVAEHLGVSPMSIYTYVPGKAELLDLMLDTVQAEIPLLDRLPGDWRARIEHWARESLASYHRHPWVLQVATSRPPMGPNEMTWSESALRALAETGLPDRELVAVVAAVGDYVRGAARTAVDAARAEQRTGRSEAEHYRDREPLLEKLITADRFPTMTRLHYSGVFDDLIDSFEFGLQRLLDGLAAYIERHAG
ncbi:MULTISPECIES: TetR/AcrR family transcriptional regulator [Thermomonospora]|uniref:AcrR family transcriptional regulator n=1 Tax=Thermomonospora cellulosilytica TaxID=1411118 RepID=A0A7W3MZ79_9ACTN|nr:MULTISPECIES: TetR/AcrR family transcriptional regulator [Thermomonospora]MBA9004599.1 AcrR family transcriptional regulator [Thermomonospora cellulosilytica]